MRRYSDADYEQIRRELIAAHVNLANLQAENKRLREALEKYRRRLYHAGISQCPGCGVGEGSVHIGDCIVGQALSEGEGKK